MTTPDAAGPPLRVLCVDDNRDAADTTAALLRMVGYESRACYTGAAAVEAFDTFAPGVCLIDLNMPGMDGDELARTIAARAGGRPVLLVAVTAMSSDVCRTRIAAAGFHLHLVKPVDPHQLLVVVDAQWRLWSAGVRAVVAGSD